jgi:hypothetical protein
VGSAVPPIQIERRDLPGELIVELALAERLSAFAEAWGFTLETAAGRPSSWVESSAFEAYAAHLVLNGLHHLELDRHDIMALMTGGADDAKLDAVGLFIDRKLVLSEDDLVKTLDDISEHSKIEFVFVQATLMDRLAEGKIEKACTGISNFAQVEALLPENPEIRHWRHLKNVLLFALAQRGMSQKPSCSLYIVWPASRAMLRPSHHGILDLRRKDVERLGVFGEVEYLLVDGPRLIELADREERRNVVQLAFSELTAFEDAPGGTLPPVKSWQGRLVAAELIEALQDANGRLRPELFADNVRYDLGEPAGSVNAGIGQTLESPARSLFHIVNNGLALVARDISQLGPLSIECRDLMVVNGCQTSFSLFRHRGALDRSVKVMAKIVATENPELVDWIIVGSNRQNHVEAAEFFGRLPFVRRLQLHFDAITSATGQRVIWFERQKGAMSEWQREHGQQVVGIEDMVRAFVSIVLERPELPQSGDWRALRALVPDRVFNANHDPEVYEITALILWRARELMRTTGYGDHYPAKNHAMLALRLLAEPPGLRPEPIRRAGRERQSSAYVRSMRETLLSDRKSREIAAAAHAMVNAVAKALGRRFDAKAFAAVDATRHLLDMAGRRTAAE